MNKLKVDIIKRFGDHNILIPFDDHYDSYIMYSNMAALLDYIIYKHITDIEDYVKYGDGNAPLSNLLDSLYKLSIVQNKGIRVFHNKYNEYPSIRITNITFIDIFVTMKLYNATFDACLCVSKTRKLLGNVQVNDCFTVTVNKYHHIDPIEIHKL